MKLLYISSIIMDHSYGSVSRKYIKMFEKYSNWDIYFFNMNSTQTVAKDVYKTSDKLHSLKYIPPYPTTFHNNNNNRLLHWYLTGLFHINDYILQINPDIVIMLFDDGPIYRYSKVLDEIRNIWKGLFIPLIPIDSQNPDNYLFQANYDACITLNDWSVKQITSITDVNYPVFSCPHIVDGFSKLDDAVIKRHKVDIYGEDRAKKYIVGCVNANNSRKRLDMIIYAFIKFHQTNPDSLLFIKTGKFEKNGLALSFNFENFIKGYPIIVTDKYYTNSQLNILYNTFDIMIHASDGEGFGLTPFEASLSGTLSILPNNTSYTSLITDEKIPNYLIPCKLYPAHYARRHTDITKCLAGQLYYSVYYDCKSYQNKFEESPSFHKVLTGIKTYIISKKLVPSENVFSDMNELIRAPWDSLQIQILVTSDLESLRYFLHWLSENNTAWPGKNRARKIIKITPLDALVGTGTPRVGLINVDHLCEKMIFYREHKDQYNKDLEHLRNFVIKQYNPKTVWQRFEKVVNQILSTNNT